MLGTYASRLDLHDPFCPSKVTSLDIEYITTDGKTAWVTLQENNAIAVIDIATATVRKVFGLGFCGIYQPDAIASFRHHGKPYLITINEGDTCDYDAFSEEAHVADGNLGRLTDTTTLGDTDNDGDFDKLFVPRGRSFSIWNARTGALVFDSGAELEPLLANLLPAEFNSNHEENGSFDNRSDNQGPEPEGVTLGRVKGRLYAYIGLERIGGVLVLDLTNPRTPEFVDYLNYREFHDAAGLPMPTGVEFEPPVPASQAPARKPR